MNLIDTHFHLDFYRNHGYWYKYLNEHHQYTLCVTNSPGVFYSCRKIYPETKYIKFALGYNPKNITNIKFDKRLFNHLIGYTKYIGEVGLDFTGKFKNSEKEQITNFEYICNSVFDYQVLSIHSKNSEKTVLRILKKYKVKKAILHWYSGDLKTLKELIDCGYYFSVNSNMINSVKGRLIIENIPIDKILVESDGPFTKINSEKYNPTKLIDVYTQLGDILKRKEIDKLIWNNFKTLLL